MLENAISLVISTFTGTIDQEWFTALICVSIVYAGVILIKSLAGWRC